MYKNLRKCISMLLAFVLICSLTACGGKETVQPNAPSEDVKTEVEENKTPVVSEDETSKKEDKESTTENKEPVIEDKKTAKEEKVEENNAEISGEFNAEKAIAEKDYLGLDVNKHMLLPLHCSVSGGDQKLIEYVAENRKVDILESVNYEDDKYKVTPLRIETDFSGDLLFLEFQNKTSSSVSVMLYDGHYINLNGLNLTGLMTTTVAANSTSEIKIIIPKVELLINNIEKIKTAELTVTAVDNNSDETFMDLSFSTSATDYEQVLITEKNDLRIVYDNNGLKVGILTEYLDPVENDKFYRVYFVENNSDSTDTIRIEAADTNVFSSGIGRTVKPGDVTSIISNWTVKNAFSSIQKEGVRSDVKAYKKDGFFAVDGSEKITEIYTEYYEGFDK